MNDQRPPPPWVGDESALVLLDWSWWLNKAFRIGGLEGMTSNVVGWLCGLLAWRPAHLAIALDCNGPTHRHRMTHPTDEAWIYKGGRDPKPADFFTLSDRLTEIADLHAIPILWAQEREADDVIATVTGRARAAGYRVWICSHDKDLCSLVESDPKSGIVVGTWDNFEGTFRGPDEVRAQFGVEPAQIPDLLAIWGDAGDKVPGVPSLGPTAAADILAHWSTLEDALAAPPWPAEQYTITEQATKRLAARIKKTTDAAERAKLTAEREQIMHVRKLAKAHAVLHAHADVARFSRLLTALDCDVACSIPWEDLPVGGFHVDELRARYNDLGFTRRANEVPAWRKRAPWVIPYEASDAA
jgi:5'-3' exonuclease